MKKIGIGIIGWGFMGRTHALAIRNIPLFYQGIDFQPELRGICSRRLEKAKEAATLLNVPYYTDDYRELLAREDIDVVSVCTPNEKHEEMVIAALKAGKHVYVDKPLAVTAESAARIAEAAAQSDCFTQMAFNNRYLPSMLRAKQLIEEGKIGEIMGFEGRYLHSGSIDPNKPIGWKQQMQGGVLLDMGSHVIDLLTWMLGYPAEVLCETRTLYAQRPTKDGGVETDLSDDHVLSMFKMPDGAIGMIEASKIATGSSDELTLDIRGTKGAIRWNLMDPNYVYFYDNTLKEAPLGGQRGYTQIESVARYPAPGGSFLPTKNTIGWDRGHAHCYFSFLDSVSKGIRPADGVEEGAKLQKLMESMLKSAEERTWVKI